jgi:hypothetical protein
MQGYVRSATVERALEWIRNRGSVQVNDGLAGITLPYRPPAWRPEATYCSVGAPLVSFLARSIWVMGDSGARGTRRRTPS